MPFWCTYFEIGTSRRKFVNLMKYRGQLVDIYNEVCTKKPGIVVTFQFHFNDI